MTISLVDLAVFAVIRREKMTFARDLKEFSRVIKQSRNLSRLTREHSLKNIPKSSKINAYVLRYVM